MSLFIAIFLVSNMAPVLAACVVTVHATPATVTAGNTVALTVTLAGCGTPSEVDYYNGGTALCVSTTSPSFGCNWTSSGSGAVTVKAILYGSGGSAPSGVYPSMHIDIVGAASPTPTGQDTNFGEQYFKGTGGTTWIEGDNQFCGVNWPYNGYSIGYPDGSCEWTNTVTNQQPSSMSSATIDGLDDAMHTMSDFSKFADSLVNLNTAATTVDNWYAQAAKWIAPTCTGTSDSCTATAFTQSACTPVSSCNKGSNGRLLSLYCPTGLCSQPVDLFGGWQQKMTSWLTNNNSYYTSAGAWCVPSETTVLNGQATTAEDAYIRGYNAPTTCADGHACSSGGLAGQCQNGNTCSNWGDLPHVIACLNYNGGAGNAGPVPVACADGSTCSLITGTCTNLVQCVFPNANSAAYSYQQCLTAMLQAATCPASKPFVCTPAFLGRSLAYADLISNHTQAPTYDGCSGNFEKYVQDSLTLFQVEANKFNTRSKYLTDVYTRANTAQNIFYQAHTALANFFKTCSGCASGSCSSTSGPGICPDGSACNAAYCQNGGPASQLMYAREQLKANKQPTRVLPNGVIYGWKDPDYPNGHTGYTHLVKVVAFAPGRGGMATATPFGAGFIESMLPWIDQWEDFFNIYYGLKARDGYVYVDVKRWDEDHNNGPLTFPNNHPLWQFLFHNPIGGTQPSVDVLNACMGQAWPGGCTSGGQKCVGYGVLPETLTGLNTAMNSLRPLGGKTDATIVKKLGQSFMLNDEGDGAIDPVVKAEAGNGSKCSNGGTAPYCTCLKDVDQLLGYGVETRACARYIASRNPGAVASGFSGTGDSDYALKFVSCDSIAALKPGGQMQNIDDLSSGEI